jgi:hypothetical protein
MGSGAVIYVPSFIKIGSGIQKLMSGDTQTHTQQRDLISLHLLFQNKESMLKMGRDETEWDSLGLIRLGVVKIGGALVNTVMNIRVLYDAGHFSIS